jgi:hypothetical protein
MQLKNNQVEHSTCMEKANVEYLPPTRMTFMFREAVPFNTIW